MMKSICVLLGILLFVTSSKEAIFSSRHERPHVVETASSMSGLRRRFDRPKRGVDDNDVTTSNNLRSTRVEINSGVVHNQALIDWTGYPSQIIFLLNRKHPSSAGDVTSSALFRSVDYGETFENIDSKLAPGTILKAYYASKTNRSKAIFVDMFERSSRVWITIDEGETFQAHKVPFSVDKIVFHPTEEDWLLGYDKKNAKLFASMDTGRTWKKLQDRVTADRYFWGVEGVDVGENSSRVVHMEYQDIETPPRRSYRVKSCFIPHCAPTAFQLECDALGPVVFDSLQIQNNFTFVEKSDPVQKFYVSFNRGTFKKAKFPGTREQMDFYVVSSEGGTVALGVLHHQGADLYFSDAKGENFAMSLGNVRYFNKKDNDKLTFTVDAHKVAGVRGALIANKMVGQSRHNRTFMTWNNGRTWNSLTLPPEHSPCSRCYLNLHCAMELTQRGYFMPGMASKASVPGLILAHGNVGTSLVDAPSMVNVFVSRDAGATWRKALKSRHLYRVGDHGAVIIAAEFAYLRPIKTIQFSNSFGRFWTELKFSDVKVHADGLLNELTSHIFTLFAHVSYQGNWNLFRLDTSSMMTRNCSYPRDFSNWTVPPRLDGGSCHLGMMDTVEKLDVDSCFIGPDYKLKTSKRTCNCTDRDYQCDFGYVIDDDDSCIRDTEYSAITETRSEYNVTPPTCVNGWRKTRTRKRRVAGDQCVNDPPGMLHTMEACPEMTTPEPTLWLEVINGTREAAVGESLVVAARGLSNIRWVVTEKSHLLVNTSFKRHQSDVVALMPTHPGYYQVDAYYEGNPHINDSVLLSFWYPIEKVELVCPPVVNVNKPYNVTALVTSRKGLPPREPHFGRMGYQWEGGHQFKKWSEESVSLKHSEERDYHIAVTVNNTISRMRAQRNVSVKPYVITLVLPLMTSQTTLSSGWLRFVRQLLEKHLQRMEGMTALLADYDISSSENIHIFMEPKLPLEANILLSPGPNGRPPQDELAQAASNLASLIVTSSPLLRFSDDDVIKVGAPRAITDEKSTQRFDSSQKGAATVALSLVAVAILAGIYNR